MANIGKNTSKKKLTIPDDTAGVFGFEKSDGKLITTRGFSKIEQFTYGAMCAILTNPELCTHANFDPSLIAYQSRRVAELTIEQLNQEIKL